MVGYTIIGVIYIILIQLGNIVNIITIIILRRDSIPNSLTFFLISLNLCDLLATQPSVILAFMYYHLTARFSDSIVFYKIYQFIKVFINPFGLLFSMCSNWLVTLAAFYRFISIKYPIRSRVFEFISSYVCFYVAHSA